MIAQISAPCWVIDRDVWGADHFSTQADAEQAAAREAVEDDEPPNWPSQAQAVCWRARCACGAGLLTASEQTEAEHGEPYDEGVIHRTKTDARDVEQTTGGRCATCWRLAMAVTR